MSTDEKVAKDLVETLRDGEKGFAEAADKLRGNEHPEWAGTMERLSKQRETFAREIVEMGHDYGDEVNESGSAGAAVHRGWLSLKDALTGDDASGVLGAAVSGEDHTVKEYEKALDHDDLSEGFRTLVSRQHQAVVAARDEVKALRDAG
ncbi:ferritin-like domain-containing protein [Phycicoccus flavus]|uniref:ferritin-like domain-containing protein n=1 Tax=Phycicoccus flavus TaxID=2502783 RepID=UPI000FEBDB54|nr:PA2169 family four-helix-bundle protein [Phycicoccus flavus]NHA66495.1 PA2169 family four-helix-bundle protein [Phycicoccus flavus]